MDTFFRNDARTKTKVTILATYSLVQSSVQTLLEDGKELKILDVVGTISELLQKISCSKPDVILYCLMKDEGKNIRLMNDLHTAAQHTKVVILSSPDSLLNQTAALKMGVTGIVSANQNVRVLTRALKQVSDGEVWLHQSMVAQLLGISLNSSFGSPENQASYKEKYLTEREMEVVGLIGLAMRNKDISKKLYISEATVRHHLTSIYGKLRVKDRLNLAIYAHQERIVQKFAGVV